MGVHLDWHSDDDTPERMVEHRPRPWRPFLTLLVMALLTAAVLLGWRAARQRADRLQTDLRHQAQALLDLEQQALLAGDGELFMSVQALDAAWRAAWLLPLNQAVTAAGPQATRVEHYGDHLAASVTWSDGRASYQRVAFFQRQEDRLLHAPSIPDYWGQRRQARYGWGSLSYREVDEPWAAEIAAFVARAVDDICDAGCLPDRRPERLPFAVTVAADFGDTAVPNQLRVPSPRLVALDSSGRPADPFWALLRPKIEAHLTLSTIRFGVPAALAPRYERAAAAFMVSQSNTLVEIVGLPALPDDLAAAGLDGAAWPPGEALLAAGRVRDLTDYANTDPGFDQVDFYEQIWQSAWWQERMWSLPLAAEMAVLFYDRPAYDQAGRAEPSPRWTWQELEADIAALVPVQPDPYLRWAFLDPGPDTLLSYAYQYDRDCATATVRCDYGLRPGDVQAALVWYAALTGRPGQMPDLTGLSPAEREMQVLNWVAPRRVAIWVDRPANYEFHLLRQPLGVVPFPGSDRFDGVTPLWVRAGFIGQHSQRPLAVWQWLKFLSYQMLEREQRLVPARPSVATQSRFWDNLPRPLGDAMRTAFPFARPVLPGETAAFSWERLGAVLSGRQTPEQAAQQPARLPWFDPALTGDPFSPPLGDDGQ